MAQSEPQYFIDSALISARQVEVPDADWDGGVNRGASNAPRLGVSTVQIDPKVQDWSRPPAPQRQLVRSQVIAGAQSAIFVIDPTFGDNSLTGFQQADADIPPDGVMPPIEGFTLINRTGQTIPAGSWAFGVADN